MKNVEKKRGILDAYLEKCAHNLSGQTMIVKAEQICSNLEEKADWLMEHIRVQEWIVEDEHTDGLMAIMTIIRIRWRAVKTERYG